MSDPKRARLDPESAPEAANPVLQAALAGLNQVQDELEKVNDEASDKVLEVEQHYNKIRRPIYASRNEQIALIPEFWKRALVSHPVLRATITEAEEEILTYLTAVDVEDFEDIKSGYKITFKFAENPYFLNAELVKSLKFADDASLTIEGDVPKWHVGKEPVEDVGSGKRPKRTDYNFFKWFVEYEKLEDGQHDDLADIIKDEIWPNPLKYYFGEVEELEGELEGDGFDFEEEGPNPEEDAGFEDEGDDQSGDEDDDA